MPFSFCLCAVTVGLLALCALPSGNACAEEPFGAGNFKTACATASQTKRIVLVDFYTTWCGPCKMLDEKTWKDAKVRQWLTQTAVCRKIDAEKQTALASRYKINAYPTILLLRPDGTEIDRLIGYRDPKTFLEEARQALAGQDGVTRAKAKLNKAGANNPMARMEYARALSEKGRLADALKEYLWCFDEGNKHDMSFYGVRLSFLLSDISGLGEQYPPALAALRKRRDAARAVLEGNAPDNEAAADFAALNGSLNEPEQTLAMYDALRAKNAPAASHLFREVSAQLLEKKRYADLIAGAGDVTAAVNQQLAMSKLDVGQIDAQTRAILKKQAFESISMYYEALAGTDKLDEANAVRDKLLVLDPSVNGYILLARQASRAGKPAAAQQVVELARAKLSPADVKIVEQAAK